MCPSGYTGALCATQLLRKCQVQITKPNLAKGCRNGKKDSEYYVYSIQGYDPCHFFDFDKNYTIDYKINCKDVNSLTQVVDKGHPEQIGFNYYDLVNATARGNQSKSISSVSQIKPEKPFNYSIVNNQTNVKLLKGASLSFTFNF